MRSKSLVFALSLCTIVLSATSCSAQLAGTSAQITNLSGTVTPFTPFPGYTMDQIAATTTHHFTVDSGESMMPPFMAQSSLWITAFGGGTIASDTGAGVTLGSGASMTRTINLSTMAMGGSGVYTVHSTAILMQMGSPPVLVSDSDSVLIW